MRRTGHSPEHHSRQALSGVPTGSFRRSASPFADHQLVPRLSVLFSVFDNGAPSLASLQDAAGRISRADTRQPDAGLDTGLGLKLRRTAASLDGQSSERAEPVHSQSDGKAEPSATALVGRSNATGSASTGPELAPKENTRSDALYMQARLAAPTLWIGEALARSPVSWHDHVVELSFWSEPSAGLYKKKSGCESHEKAGAHLKRESQETDTATFAPELLTGRGRDQCALMPAKRTASTHSATAPVRSQTGKVNPTSNRNVSFVPVPLVSREQPVGFATATPDSRRPGECPSAGVWLEEEQLRPLTG